MQPEEIAGLPQANAGVIVATPGWALPGGTSRQAHRGQALAWVILFRPSSLSGAGGLGC